MSEVITLETFLRAKTFFNLFEKYEKKIENYDKKIDILVFRSLKKFGINVANIRQRARRFFQNYIRSEKSPRIVVLAFRSMMKEIYEELLKELQDINKGKIITVLIALTILRTIGDLIIDSTTNKSSVSYLSAFTLNFIKFFIQICGMLSAIILSKIADRLSLDSKAFDFLARLGITFLNELILRMLFTKNKNFRKIDLIIVAAITLIRVFKTHFKKGIDDEQERDVSSESLNENIRLLLISILLETILTFLTIIKTRLKSN